MSYLLCSPASATRWCSNSSAVVILPASARDRGRVHRVCQHSVVGCLLVVTASHSLFVYRASRVLAFVVKLLNPSSLVHDFVVARALTRFVSSPARSKLDLVIISCVIKKSQESGEDEASRVIFTKCATKSSNILRDSSSIRQNYSIEEKIFNK
jgi:hypothetical protein